MVKTKGKGTGEGRGGARPGSGRPAKPKVPQFANKGIASRVLAAPANKESGWTGEEQRWMELLNAKDERLRFDVQKYLTDRRDGKPAQGVFVGDTRESERPLDFGDLPMPSANPGGAGKPN